MYFTYDIPRAEYLRDAVNGGSLLGIVTRAITTEEVSEVGRVLPGESVVRPEGLDPPQPPDP